MIWRRLLFWVPLVAIVSAFPILIILLRSSNELGSKPENSFLQALEVQYRGKPLDDRLIVKRRNEYCAVGILASDGKSRVWILLNPKYQPLVKEIGAQDYRITRDELDLLKKECRLNESVARVLEEHVR
jgi:hypothetical protein